VTFERAPGKEWSPFQGVGAFRPSGRRVGPPLRSAADYPDSGDKRVADLKTALHQAGLRDGMTLSTHHHLRNGDHVAMALFQAVKELGAKDVVWFPSAVFPCHASLIPYLEDGTIHHIEGSLNGPVGDFASTGQMRGLAVLRSHGSRLRAVIEGDVRIDIAVVAAPACDMFGNMTGAFGPSACGSLGFAVGDAETADHVIAVTDNLVDFPCVPWQIAGNHVDQVVVVDSIGDATQIVSGTTQMTRSPERLLIGKLAAQFVREAGIMRDGWSFQAGAGGVSLAFTVYLADMMREAGVTAAFARGGSTRYLVEMLETGLVKTILDGQTFDLDGVRSIRENERHVMTSPFNSYNFHGKGRTASMLDVAVLGATEVDMEFNANVATHSDGRMLHGLGGWQDALFSRCTILAVPSLRNRIPVLRDQLTTRCGPGELVDVVVTERGIAINPRRQDLVDATRGSRLPIRPIQEIKRDIEDLAGGPPAPARCTDETIGLVTWVDGTVIDQIRRVQP